MTEIELLERRVAALEQEVEGEKLVTRHILDQVRRATDELAALRSQMRRMEDRFDQLDTRLRAIESRFDRLESELHSWKLDWPRQIAEVMREVLAERDARR